MSEGMAYALYVYLILAALTFGHQFRCATQEGTSLRIKMIAVRSIAWPAYWIVIHGLVGTFNTILSAISNMIGSFVEFLNRIISATSLLVSTTVSAVGNMAGSFAEFFTRIIRILFSIASTVGALVSEFLSASEGVMWFIYVPVAIFVMPAYQLYHRWDAAHGFFGVLVAIAKSLLWGVFWPGWLFATWGSGNIWGTP